MGQDQTNAGSATTPRLEPEDYYFDGPNIVFTAAYHLKRGSCCGSGCRHCPYGFIAVDKSSRPALNHGADAPAEDTDPAAG